MSMFDAVVVVSLVLLMQMMIITTGLHALILL